MDNKSIYEDLTLEQINERIEQNNTIIYNLAHRCYIGDRAAIELSNAAETALYELKAVKQRKYGNHFSGVTDELKKRGFLSD